MRRSKESEVMKEELCGTKEVIQMMTTAIFDKFDDDRVAVENMIGFLLQLNLSIQGEPAINAAA